MASFFDSSTSFSSDPCPYCPEIVNLVNYDLKIKKKNIIAQCILSIALVTTSKRCTNGKYILWKKIGNKLAKS